MVKGGEQWRIQDFLKGFLSQFCAQSARKILEAMPIFSETRPFRSFWAKLSAQLSCFQTTSLLTHAKVSHSSSLLRSVAREGVPFPENHSHSIKCLYFKSTKRGFPQKLWKSVWIRYWREDPRFVAPMAILENGNVFCMIVYTFTTQ